MRTMLFLILVATVCVAQTPPPPQKAEPATKPAEKKADTLADDITKALRTHPDVLVAEAEVQLANAKLQQVRQLVAQKVATAKQDIERARIEVEAMTRAVQSSEDAIKSKHETLSQLKGAGVGTSRLEMLKIEEEFQRAVAAIQGVNLQREQAKLKLANCEREYRTIIGDQPRDNGKIGMPLALVQGFELKHVAGGEAHKDSTTSLTSLGSVGKQLEAALNKPVKLALKDTDIPTAYKMLMQAAQLNLAVRTPPREDPKFIKDAVKISVDTAEYTLAAWLSLLTDEINQKIDLIRDDKPQKLVNIYVREYGLLVSTVELAPKDAISLSEFIQQARNKKQ